MSRTTDGTDRLGVLLAIPEGLPPLRIGALPIPVRLLRQFRKAGAGPPAVLVFSNWHRARAWQRTAAEEGAVAVTTKELPGVMASTRVRGWIYAPGDLVLSGEGLEEALRRAPANSQAIVPDGHPAGWSIAPPSGDGAIAWVRAMCGGKPVDPLTAATIPLPHQTVLGRAVDAATAERLDDAVMRGLAREEDPNFTRLSGRRISRRISRRLAAQGVMPNTVTAAAVVLGLAAATMILQGGYVWTVAGACVLALSRILDDCDGEVARLTFRQSTFGARFDVTGDIVVYTAVFLALASGLHRLDPAGRYLWALALLLFGAAITTVLVLGFVTGSRLPEESRLLRLMERGASGDFAYLLLLFALVGRAQWFLWAAAVGSQVYWVTLGVAVLLSQRKASVRTRVGGGGGTFSALEAALFMAGVVLLVLLVIVCTTALQIS